MKTKSIVLAISLAVAAAQGAVAEEYSGYTVTDEGAWCWFADPRAIHYESADKSINASYIGYIDVHGNVKAMQMDFNTGRRDEVLVRSYFQPDDHNNPTFLVLPDQRVLIIYSRHTDEPAFYYRVSQKPGDITTFGPEFRLATANNTTYPSPFLMSDDPDHFYLCWRGIGWHPTIARLTLPDAKGECKFDWGPYQIVQSTGARPYAKYFSNGKDKIYVTYTTGHPDNEGPNWLYFNVININKGNNPTLEDLKGNKLSTIADGTFKVNKTNDYKTTYPYTVVDAPSSLRDWVWQTVLDKDGNPVIAMVKISSNKQQHEYYYAKWMGDSWRLTDLADGGGRFHSSNTEYCYSGGEAIDPANPNIIYLSIPTDGTYGKVYEIWKYTLDANGNVTAKEAITTNSQKNNVRPYILPGSENSPLRLGWMNGDYYYWMVQKNYPLGYPTSIRCDYNWVETATVPEPVVSADNKTVALQPQFTVNTTLFINPTNYGGELMTLGNVAIGLDKETTLPYVDINGTRYSSTNKLYTSDLWATNSGGTSGDNWPTPQGQWNLTVTYDGKNLKTYRNGMLDQNIEVAGLTPSQAKIGTFDGTASGLCTYAGAMTWASVQQMLREAAIEAIYVPESACSDMVLPTKVGGSQIAWASSHPEIIAPDGTFRAPEAETEVTLTANIAGQQRQYKVKALPRNLVSNLLAKYTFDVLTDINTVEDATGHGFDMMIYGSAVIDGTLNLNNNKATGFASNGYAIVPGHIMDGLRSYTITLDATPKSVDKQPRLYDFGYNSGNSFFLRAKALSAGIKYAGGTTTMTNSSASLATEKTNKLAVTFDARTKTTCIYLNGELVATGNENINEPYMIALDNVCDRCYIGRTQWWDGSYANDNGDYVGSIDNLCIYNTALTEAEIKEMMGYRQSDESLNIDYTSALANPDFEAAYEVLSNSGVTSDRAIYVPQGWTADYTDRNENDMTILNSTCLYASLFSNIPTTSGGGANAYLARQKWGASSISMKQACDTLSAGCYAIGGEIWQSGMGGNGTIWAEPQSGQKAAATVANAEAWQKTSATFFCDGVQTVTFGITALHNSNGDEKYIGFDNITLYDVTANCTDDQLLELLDLMITAADGLSTEGLDEYAIKYLNDASRDAKGMSETSSTDELMASYKKLREALRMAKGTSGIADAAAPADADLPVYDLTGRKVNSTSLRPGIYVRGNRKIAVK